ncbi:hypothetical protein [Streptomyces sp. NRRL S-448]|uniref:hypothetical protein n=1 Tax=Streptomyces sp. NRRL S-448 TaxID=1463907 RepID=UPI0035683AB4
MCHLKSKLLCFPDGRSSPRNEGERARYAAYALFRCGAEAVTVRALADELLAGDGEARDVALLGDLNDEPVAATTQILLGPPGSQIGTSGFERPDQGDQSRLWNLAPRIPEDQRHSGIHAGQPELIDHSRSATPCWPASSMPPPGLNTPCPPSAAIPSYAGTNPPPSSPPSATPETPRRNWRTCQESDASWPSPFHDGCRPGHCPSLSSAGPVPVSRPERSLLR